MVKVKKIRRCFTVSPVLWEAFQEACGKKSASKELERLMMRYIYDHGKKNGGDEKKI